MHLVKFSKSRIIDRAGIVLLICAAGVINALADDASLSRYGYDLSYESPRQGQGSQPQTVQASDLRDLSARIYLIADNQRHELLGDGVAWIRNSFADAKFSGTSIRPPQLDLFGQDLLIEALGMIDGFVLHLGDAADVSTTGEFARFAFDMQRAPQGWIMAPGNHDGYLFGNSSRIRDRFIREWDAAAESYELDGTDIDSRGMQKDRFISYYLSALILQDDVWSGPLARSLGTEMAQMYAQWTRRETGAGAAETPRTFARYWTTIEAMQQSIYEHADADTDQGQLSFELPEEAVPADRPYLHRLAWHIDKEKVWRSFIVQELDIRPSRIASSQPISILVLDSSQYGVRPSLDHGAASNLFSKLSFGIVDIQVAGVNANLLDSQEIAIDEIVLSMQQDGRRWIVASHHPYDEFGRASAPRFNQIRDAGGIPVTLSAHTHAGELRWNRDKERKTDWLEINVGSMVDAPVEFRDLQVQQLDGRVAISTHRYAMAQELNDRGLIIDQAQGYRASPEDPDFYLNYTDGLFGTEDEADFMVKRILLAAYLRMLRLFEADDADQSSTYWPTGPDGTRLTSHDDVVAAVESLVAELTFEDLGRLTRFLYELRKFDRTRKFTEPLGAELRKYRLSQAIWAGLAELSTWDVKAPETDPDISFVLLPREPVSRR